MTIYFLSGLGADKRAFKKLTLPGNWDIKYIEWLDNYEGESLVDYCHRIAGQIDTSRPFSLVGLSFGGIVAVELSKFLNPGKIIIISSIATRSELPWTFEVLRRIPLHKIAPPFFYNEANFWAYWFLGTKTPEEKALLREIIADTHVRFAQWAVAQIISWNNQTRPPGLIHIIGTSDKIFHASATNADIKIPGAEHFMIYSQADIISEILKAKLG